MDRIFTVCHVTPLMVVLHMRRHLNLPKAREFLIWYPMADPSPMEGLMRDVISAAGFDATLDIRGFESLKPRTQGPLSWWFESARRFRKDAQAIRRWLEIHDIVESDTELWADDPIHFNVIFLKGLLRSAHQIKFPHCFNHDDATSPAYMNRLTAKLRAASVVKRVFFLPWLKLVSGVDGGPDHVLNYAEGYTFDQPSCWAPRSIDISRLISIEAFKDTYEGLPPPNRADIEATLAPINEAGAPIVLLLLFGLSAPLRIAYQNAMSRIFQVRRKEFTRCSLVVKTHPASEGGKEEGLFFQWLEGVFPGKVFVISHPLNLEFLLPRIKFTRVLAGPCGALPIIRRLHAGSAVVLPEIMDEFIRMYPDARDDSEKLVAGIEVW